MEMLGSLVRNTKNKYDLVNNSLAFAGILGKVIGENMGVFKPASSENGTFTNAGEKHDPEQEKAAKEIIEHLRMQGYGGK